MSRFHWLCPCRCAISRTALTTSRKALCSDIGMCRRGGPLWDKFAGSRSSGREALRRRQKAYPQEKYLAAGTNPRLRDWRGCSAAMRPVSFRGGCRAYRTFQKANCHPAWPDRPRQGRSLSAGRSSSAAARLAETSMRQASRGNRSVPCRHARRETAQGCTTSVHYRGQECQNPAQRSDLDGRVAPAAYEDARHSFLWR